jgi:glyoxylase-like metal-dependent hydrolase (beta-lactamase superfamily II)
MIEEVRDGRLLLVKIGPLGPVANNVYVVADTQTNDAVIVDAPEGCEAVAPVAKGLDVRQIVITHRHRDHWAGIETMVGKFDVPVLTHPDDVEGHESFVKATLVEDDEVGVGSLRLKVLHTPGHTPGSICLHFGDHLLSGDTLFPGGPGRTRSNEALQQEIASITSKLYALPEGIAVYPGHGANTTIGASKGEYAVFASKQHAPDLSGDVLWLSS